MRCFQICMAVLVGLVPVAQAEILEMRYFAYGTELREETLAFDVLTGRGSGMLEVILIWDTEAPPTATDTFPILDYTITFHDLTPNPEDNIVFTPENGGDLEFRLGGTEPFLWVEKFIPFSPPGSGGVVFSIRFYHLQNVFFSGMTSMPDDPLEYAVNLNSAQALESSFQWNNLSPTRPTMGGDSFGRDCTVGTLARYTVTVHTPPPPEPCSPADMNADGSLNFLDVSEFLNVYGDGCP